VQELTEAIEEFLAAPKSASNGIRWRSWNHPDYLISQVRLSWPDQKRMRARIFLSSHIFLDPRKYMFSLLFGSIRVMSLDVDPQRSHRNLLRRESVSATHWSRYPCDEVVSDSRVMSHRKWLEEFCVRCRISNTFHYEQPAHDREQFRLL
jgi:hypothetical protein